MSNKISFFKDYSIYELGGWYVERLRSEDLSNLIEEISENPKQRIYRPRQIYTGENLRSYIPLDER